MMDMQGRRRPDGTETHLLEPGDYALNADHTVVWANAPADGDDRAFCRIDERWKIIVEEDETVTCAPLQPGGAHSILIKAGDREVYHGWLVKGQWTTKHPGM